VEHDLAELSSVASAVFIGLVIGLRHSTDGDHVVAVSTMARDYRSVFKGLWVGVSWGLGHSTPLLLLGILILAVKESLMDFYESTAVFFEFGVALMLVFLGLQVFWKMRQGEFHIHEHEHDSQGHKHLHGSHGHLNVTESPHSSNRHGPFPELIPFFRTKSYVIGVVHGLAGSAAVLVGILAATPDFFSGMVFLVCFSLGTMISMALMTVLLSVPFVVSSWSNNVGNLVIIVAGILSITLGLALGSDLAFGTDFTGILWY
jgi:ABC-type nickel/cobalt efflux system permease component RcnA